MEETLTDDTHRIQNTQSPFIRERDTMGYGTSVEFLDTKTTIPLYTINPNIAYTHGRCVG